MDSDKIRCFQILKNLFCNFCFLLLKGEIDTFTFSFSRCAPNARAHHQTAWDLLYQALEEHYGISREMAAFARSENGKPYLTSHPDIYFSLSHAHGCAVCAVSDAPIGIDVEKIRAVSPRIKRDILSLTEDSSDACAIKRWTELESYAKLRGARIFGMTYEKDIKKTAEAICRFESPSHTLGEEYLVTVCCCKDSTFQEGLPVL